MFYGAKGGRVKIDKTHMDYVTFGEGQNILILIPGLGDGLKTVKGTQYLMVRMYKLFAKKYKVYIFSRKNHMEEGYSTRDMAADQKKAMNILGIKSANILGVSQGGMIAQYLAIDNPKMVDKLVLGVTISKQNSTIQNVVQNWIAFAKNNDYKNLIIDTMEKTFSENKLRKYRAFYPIITRVGKPRNFRRFIIQAESCLEHNSYDELNRILCPTLIIGGDSDNVVGKNASEEMAEKISGSKLILYEGLGHGAYEEAKDFKQRILGFLSPNSITY